MDAGAAFQTELIPPTPGSGGAPRERYIVTRDQLAQVLGLKPVTINAMVADGMPKLQHGRYDLAACVQWDRDRWRARLEEKAPSDTSERKRYDAARAAAAELSLAERRRELVPIVEVRKVMTQVVGAVVRPLQAMPARLAPELAALDDPGAVQAALTEAVHGIRTDIGAALGDLAGAGAGGKARKSAAKKGSRRVGRRKADPAA